MLKKESRTNRTRARLIWSQQENQQKNEQVFNTRLSGCFETWRALSTASWLRALLYWNYEVPSSISRAFERGSVAFSDAFAQHRGTIAKWPFFIFKRISDLITVENHCRFMQILGMCLDNSPTWLQTQRRSSAPGPNPHNPLRVA